MDSVFLQNAVIEAFQKENELKPKKNLVLIVDESGQTQESIPENIGNKQKSISKNTKNKPSQKYERVLCFNYLSNIFNARSGFTQLLSLVKNDGSLIYGHNFSNSYFGLTAKWLLDSFVFSNCERLYGYLFWIEKDGIKSAAYNFEWIYQNSTAKYNPMWDNEIYAAFAVFVASYKNYVRKTRQIIPAQDIYRPEYQWNFYKKRIQKIMKQESIPHFNFPSPAKVPPGFSPILNEERKQQILLKNKKKPLNKKDWLKRFILKLKKVLSS